MTANRFNAGGSSDPLGPEWVPVTDADGYLSVPWNPPTPDAIAAAIAGGAKAGDIVRVECNMGAWTVSINGGPPRAVELPPATETPVEQQGDPEWERR